MNLKPNVLLVGFGEEPPQIYKQMGIAATAIRPDEFSSALYKQFNLVVIVRGIMPLTTAHDKGASLVDALRLKRKLLVVADLEDPAFHGFLLSKGTLGLTTFANLALVVEGYYQLNSAYQE